MGEILEIKGNTAKRWDTDTKNLPYYIYFTTLSTIWIQMREIIETRFPRKTDHVGTYAQFLHLQ